MPGGSELGIGDVLLRLVVVLETDILDGTHLGLFRVLLLFDVSLLQVESVLLQVSFGANWRLVLRKRELRIGASDLAVVVCFYDLASLLEQPVLSHRARCLNIPYELVLVALQSLLIAVLTSSSALKTDSLSSLVK